MGSEGSWALARAFSTPSAGEGAAGSGWWHRWRRGGGGWGGGRMSSGGRGGSCDKGGGGSGGRLAAHHGLDLLARALAAFLSLLLFVVMCFSGGLDLRLEHGVDCESASLIYAD